MNSRGPCIQAAVFVPAGLLREMSTFVFVMIMCPGGKPWQPANTVGPLALAHLLLAALPVATVILCQSEVASLSHTSQYTSGHSNQWPSRERRPHHALRLHGARAPVARAVRALHNGGPTSTVHLTESGSTNDRLHVAKMDVAFSYLDCTLTSLCCGA